MNKEPTMEYPMDGVFYTKIRTEFNDGSVIEQNEVRTALIVGFTAASRKGVKSTEFLEWIEETPTGEENE